MEFPSEACLQQRFEAHVQARPETIAVVCRGVSLRYRELNERANQLAHHLRAIGVRPDTRVAICIERRVEMIIALLAVLKAGGAYVPFDPAYPPERVRFMLDDSAPVAILAHGATRELIAPLAPPAMRVLDLADGAAAWADGPRHDPPFAKTGMTPANLAHVIYTSGSTGRPKGVQVEHRQLSRYIASIEERFGWPAGTRIGLVSTLAADLGHTALFGALLLGGTLHILTERDTTDPHAFGEYCRTHALDALKITPSHFRALFDGHGDRIPARWLIFGGEVLARDLVASVRALRPECRIYNHYGPTECTVGALAGEVGRDPAPRPGAVTLGAPLREASVYILDSEREPVPPDVVGELYIGGAGVARGYLHQPALTAERFVEDPFTDRPGARMYATGDLVRRRPDGTIAFVGRNDFQVKIRGFRIEPGEIEARLRRHPRVQDAMVLAREDQPGDARLVAYYIASALPEPATPATRDALREHLARQVPDYMVPTEYVRLDAWPLTPNGKVDRQALPRPVSEGDVSRYEAPVGAVERTLAGIWAAVLKVDRVGRHDNFFALGGHSLLAVKMLARMRQADLVADVSTLFATQTLAELAAAIQPHAAAPVVPPNRIPDGCDVITPDMLSLVSLTPGQIAEIVDRTPGGAVNVQDIYPLAPLQEGILFHYLMGGEGDPYLVASQFAFDDRSRLDSYLAALQHVIDRHDILRTAVMWEALPEPVQVVSRRAVLPVQELVLDPADGPIITQLYARCDPRRVRLDLRRPPLLQAFLAHDPVQERWLLVQLFHHLLGDHTAIEVMLAEIQAHLSGTADALPPPPPFRNLVAHARLAISRDEHETFFRQALGDVAEPTAPYGLLDTQGDGGDLAQARLTIEPSLARRLRSQARQLGVSAATLCHVAWARVLASLSNRDDVVFGTVLFGRLRGGDGAERAMGLFMNTLPIRIQVDMADVETCVRRTHRQLAALLQHEHAPLALAQRCSAVPAPTPLFSSLLNYRHNAEIIARAGEREQAWAGIQRLRVDDRSNYPVTLSVDDLRDAFGLTAQVAPPAEPALVCEYMRTALTSLVDALEHAPATQVRALEMLPRSARQQMVIGWNRIEAEPAPDLCLHEWFETQVHASPRAIALVCEQETVSYETLNARANQLAHHLRALAVGPDALVAICVQRGIDLVVAVLAVLKAGGAYVPLDAAYPAELLRFMVADCTPVAVITDRSAPELAAGLANVLQRGGGMPPVVDLAAAEPAWRDLPETNLPRADTRVEPGHLAYVIYTSGSTGTPKGVMVQHAQVTRLFTATASWFHFDEYDVWTLFHSCAFDFSVWELWGALLHGGRLVIVSRDVARAPDAFYALVCRERVTVLNQTPSAFRQLVGAQAVSGDAHRLRLVILGGEALDVTTLLPWFQQNSDQRTRLINMYGITETTVHVTWRPLEVADTRHRGGSPIGRRIPDLRLYILDAHLVPVPVGVAGELYVGGAGLARGYLHRPALTAERFVADPFAEEPGTRMYRTGDVGRWRSDGTIEFLGRNDSQIKIRGFRIELNAIEARLREHPAVREAIVIAYDQGTANARLVAYYTSARTVHQERADAGEAETLRAHLAALLPEYMIPTAYVRLPALPLTPNGKLDRHALPVPDSTAYAVGHYEPPVGPVEIALAAIWRNVLGVERVGRHDNFFTLGGHSMLAVTVVVQMQQAGLPVDVRALFATPTLAALAAAVEPRTTAVTVPPNRIPDACTALTPDMLPLVSLTSDDIVRIAACVPGGASNVQDIYPLGPLQEGILFHYVMGGGDPYVVASQYAFDTRARLDSYLAALQAVVDRHDILRTAVLWEGLSEPVQVVWRRATLSVAEMVLDPDGGDAAAQLYARCDPRQARIDIRRAPLLRITIARDPAQGRWLMVQLLQHLAGDHTTLDVMQEEIQAHLLGEADRLPAPLPFRNLVAHARLGVSRDEHEAFFRALLGDVTEPTAPFGLLDVRGDGTGVSQARVTIDTSLARRLRSQARQLGVSAASVCHVAWAQVVGRVSGRHDVVFGTVLFGRMQGGAGADRVMGPFINTLPLRMRIDTTDVERCVRRTHEQLAALLRHEHASLTLAQRCSAVPAPAPLFTALLNYRHRVTSERPGADQRKRGWEGIQGLRGEERTNYPFTLSVDDLGAGFRLTAQVMAPLDPARVCEYMETALASLVDALEHAPATAICAIEVLPEHERRRVLREWTRRAEPFLTPACFHELFETQVRATPDAPAIVDDTCTITFAELNRRANQLAHHLVELGAGPEDIVGLCAPRSAATLAALIAILKTGAAYLPLDPAYPAERLAFMVHDARPVFVLASGRAQLPNDARLVPIDAAERAAISAPATDSTDADRRTPLLPQHTAYVIYTSGSTGRPKGVVVSHLGIAGLVESQRAGFAMTPQARVLQFASLSFDAAFAECAVAWLCGASIVIAPPEQLRPGDDLAALVAERRVTHFTVPPAVLRVMPADSLSTCSTLIVAGDSCSPELAARWSPARRLVNAYGPTEITVCATLSPPLGAIGGAPIGTPILNTCVYVLDAYLQPMPVGVPGELFIAGTGLARGYLHRPAMSAERFLANPFGEPGTRLYRTGDRVMWRQDGQLDFLGRLDDQIKIRGYRIEPGEVEAALLRDASVADAVVVPRMDWSDEKQLVAYVVPLDGMTVEVPLLSRRLANQLPEHMVPSAIVVLDRLPMTPNGKVDRHALPAPDGTAHAAERYEAPIGEVERTLAAIWAAVLKVERVGRADNFFALGGHSLLAVAVIERMRQAGLAIDVRALFTTPTLADLAAASGIEQSAVAVPPNLIPQPAIRAASPEDVEVRI